MKRAKRRSSARVNWTPEENQKLEKRWRDLCALAENSGATPAEAQSAAAAAGRIAAKLRARGWELEREPEILTDLVPPPPAVEPQGIPTIQIFVMGRATRSGRARNYKVPAAFWCPACGMGRNHGGHCPVCRGRVEATGLDTPELLR